MTNAEIYDEIAKLEYIKITLVDIYDAYRAIGDAIDALKRELYKDNPAALKLLGLN